MQEVGWPRQSRINGNDDSRRLLLRPMNRNYQFGLVIERIEETPVCRLRGILDTCIPATDSKGVFQHSMPSPQITANAIDPPSGFCIAH